MHVGVCMWVFMHVGVCMCVHMCGPVTLHYTLDHVIAICQDGCQYGNCSVPNTCM